MKTDEKVSNHVLRGSGDQPAGGAVALYRAVDVWLDVIYTHIEQCVISGVRFFEIISVKR